MNVGDVVRLKSGGPRMTVVSRSNDGSLFCGWYSQKDEDFKFREFEAQALEHVRD